MNARTAYVLVLLGLAACAPANLAPTDRGYQLLDAGRYREARDALAAELKHDPHNPYIELNLAAAEQELGHIDQAAALYRRAIADGRDIVPKVASDPNEAGMTLSDVACTNLRAALHDKYAC
ncbi:MAG: tetratricopeptide repeat protein [Rhizomicrobium sp.]|jgi:tetratricopeptide (TPR) repeat protein